MTIVIMAVGTGIAAHYFGFHAAVGAYMAGLILKEEYFDPEANKKSYKRTTSLINAFAFDVFGPIFFVTLGAKLIFDWAIFVAIIPQVIALALAVFVTQITSAAIAARYTNAMT